MTGVYEITMKARGWPERKEVVWFANEGVYNRFVERTKTNGVEIVSAVEIKVER